MRPVSFYFTLVFVWVGSIAYAQTGTISGTILDATNAAVPGAIVTAKNQATASVRTATSGLNGTYSIPDLPIGSYDVGIEKQGFSMLQFRDVQLTVAQNLTLNGALQLGPVTQTVEVSGAS